MRESGDETKEDGDRNKNEEPVERKLEFHVPLAAIALGVASRQPAQSGKEQFGVRRRRFHFGRKKKLSTPLGGLLNVAGVPGMTRMREVHALDARHFRVAERLSR